MQENAQRRGCRTWSPSGARVVSQARASPVATTFRRGPSGLVPEAVGRPGGAGADVRAGAGHAGSRHAGDGDRVQRGEHLHVRAGASPDLVRATLTALRSSC
jgi:hypothetical protein